MKRLAVRSLRTRTYLFCVHLPQKNGDVCSDKTCDLIINRLVKGSLVVTTERS